MPKQLYSSLFSIITSISLSVFITPMAFAHGGAATLDPEGNSPTFTALARITCSDDGNGDAEYLLARIRDNSPAEAGHFINLQLLKSNRAISITDTTPGDAEYTPYIQLNGGNGTYYLMLNKTAAGARDFDLEWHCMTANNIHTGTDIIVDQYQ